MNQARKEIHCEEADRLGLTGAGIGVAVIDTGEGGELMGAAGGAGKGQPKSHVHNFHKFSVKILPPCGKVIKK